MKKVFMLILIGIATFNLNGCGNSDVKDIVNENIEVFMSGNMEDINKILFENQDSSTGSEVNEFENKILSNIFSNSTIKIKKVEKDVVELKVIAPDMKDVFKNLPDSSEEYTEDGLLEYMQEYVGVVETCEFIVDLPYTKDGEEIVIDYRDEDFVNAITGGMLSAYKELYFAMLDEFRNGVD